MQLESSYLVITNDEKLSRPVAEELKSLIDGGAIIVQATPVHNAVHYVIRKTTFLEDMNKEIKDAQAMSKKIKAAKEAKATK